MDQKADNKAAHEAEGVGADCDDIDTTINEDKVESVTAARDDETSIRTSGEELGSADTDAEDDGRTVHEENAKSHTGDDVLQAQYTPETLERRKWIFWALGESPPALNEQPAQKDTFVPEGKKMPAADGLPELTLRGSESLMDCLSRDLEEHGAKMCGQTDEKVERAKGEYWQSIRRKWR